MLPSQMYARSALSTAIWPRKLVNSAFVPTPLAQPAVVEAPPPASTVTAASEVYHAAVGLPDGDSVDERVTDRVTVTEAAALFDGVMLGDTLAVAVTAAVGVTVTDLDAVAVAVAVTVAASALSVTNASSSTRMRNGRIFGGGAATRL